MPLRRFARIMRAFEYSNYNEFNRIVCWAHVIRNVDKKLASTVATKEIRSRIRADVCKLQLCPSKDMFIIASQHFISKWKCENKFTKYFKKQWLNDKRQGWYQGFAVGIPCENNALEGSNRYIKEDVNCKRHGLMQFMSHLERNMLLNWSSQRNPESYDYKRFSNEPTMELKDCTYAYQWSTYGKEIVKHKYDGETIYCIPGNGNNKLSRRDCKKYFDVI